MHYKKGASMNIKSILCVVAGISIFLGHAQDLAVNTPNIYYVILAGGSGQRLWPLSRNKQPKQLLSLGSEATLLDQAINRALMMTYEKFVWVSTTANHESSVRELVGHRVGNISIEPGSRDTGPAILLNCFEIYEQDPNAIIVFLPADPFIPTHDYKKFSHSLEHAIDFVSQHDNIALLGVEPTYPATGYGYIEYDNTETNAPYPVIKFREKPSLEVAQQYLEKSTMLWNISIFCAKAETFLQEFKSHAPEMYADIQKYKNKELPYNKVKAESIDYAVMEHSKKVHVLPADFSWCDVGNIEVFLALKQQYNTLDSNFISVDSRNNLVDVPKKLVALVGVDDLCIVDTGDALLITKRNKAERVRSIVKLLKTGNFDDYI